MRIFLLFCTSAIVSMTREEGYIFGCCDMVVGEDAGWIDFLEGLGFGLAHGLLDQRIGLEGWRQSPAMGGFWHLLRPELRGIS